MNREYNEAMSQLQFSDEAKKNMAAMLSAAQKQKGSTAGATRPRRSTTWRVAAACGLAAALMLALGGVAYATGSLRGVAAAFDDVFGGPPAQTEVKEKIGRPIGASATADGITVTADSIIGDKYNYVIVYNVTKDDGTPFDVQPLENGYLPLYFEGGTTSAYEPQSSGGSSYFFDAVPGDNAIQHVIQLSVNMAEGESMIGKTLHANFGKLVLIDGKSEPKTLANGPWNMKFVVNYEDTSRTLSLEKPCTVSGMDATIDEVTLSPIAINVKYTVNEAFELEQQDSGKTSERNASEQDRFGALPIAVTMKDGSTLELPHANMAGSIREDNGKSKCTKAMVFNEFLNLDEVASITVGGAEIPFA